MGYKQIPVIGPWMSQIGKVSRIMSSPCNYSPQVAVQAVFHGVPVLIWSLFKPDPFDDRKDLFGLGKTHGRGHRVKNAKMIFGKGGTINKLTWWVFELGEAAETAGWWLMIADTGVNLAVHFTSAAYTYAGCRAPFGADCYGDANRSIGASGDLPNALGWFNVKRDGLPKVAMSPTQITIAAGRTPMISGQVDVRPVLGGTFASVGRTQIIELNSGVVVAEAINEGDVHSTSPFAMYAPIDLISPNQRSYQLRYSVLADGGWQQSGGFFQAFSEPDVGLAGDP